MGHSEKIHRISIFETITASNLTFHLGFILIHQEWAIDAEKNFKIHHPSEYRDIRFFPYSEIFSNSAPRAHVAGKGYDITSLPWVQFLFPGKHVARSQMPGKIFKTLAS